MSADIALRVRHRQGDFTLDLDIALPAGEVTGLFGHSGSGKTTCLRIMAGLVRPDAGFLRVNGDTWLDTAHGIDLPTYKRPLGYVFQEPSLFEHLDVRRNLQFGQKRVSAQNRRVDLAHITALLGIDGLLARMPDSLSGGERQRVGIARALLTSPRLLLMDEPLAALDGARKREILPYLQRLHDNLKIPIVYVSHAPDELARLADHLVVLEAGRAVASGPIASTLARLDLPASRTDAAASVLVGTAGDYDDDYGLLTVHLRSDPDACADCLRLIHPPIHRHAPVRLAVRARDVSLVVDAQSAGSILNRLRATIEAVAPAEDAHHVIVRLNAQDTLLLARITRYSWDHLGLRIGMPLWAQIKAVSLLS